MTDWTRSPFEPEIAMVRHIPEVETMLRAVCEMTGMGFAAIARVTDKRWIACQVEDRIDFGLKAGDELDLKTTICDEIRQCGWHVIIDHVSAHPDWRTHHTPAMYGFESYISIPIQGPDGFFGTLCAIDPAPSREPLARIFPQLKAIADRIGAALLQIEDQRLRQVATRQR